MMENKPTFYKLHHFNSGDKICADDFKNEEKVSTINLLYISSLTELMNFNLPFSGNFVDNYSVLKMNNGEIFYLKEDSFSDLTDVINKF